MSSEVDPLCRLGGDGPEPVSLVLQVVLGALLAAAEAASAAG